MRSTLLAISQLVGAAHALETGVMNVGVSTFAASFAGDYAQPVVIAGVPTHTGDEEIIIRVTSVDTRTKTIQFYADTPNHQGEGTACSATFHLAEEVAWMIVESTAAGPGPDAPVQAGTVMSPADADATMAGPSRWVDAVFNPPIQNPVCLSQIQSHNGGDFCKTRQRNASPNGFQITMEEDGYDTRHKQETYGWVALPAATGVLGPLHYQALNTPDAVTHTPYPVPLSGGFRTAPAIFASMQTFDGADPSALRRTDTSTTSVSVFVEEETCTDLEQAHTTEVVGVLAIEATHQIDSQLQSTLPAGLGDLTPPMIAEHDYVHIPNGSPGVGSGEAQYNFNCDAAVPELLLAFEVRAPNGNDDSFFIGMDSGDHFTWHIPRTNTDGGVSANGATATHQGASGCVRGHCEDTGGFHWATYQDTFGAGRGRHTLHVYGREDGTQLRKVRFVNAPGCTWDPTLPPQTPQIAAVFGKLTAPMTMQDDFIVVPETFVAGANGQVGEGGCIDGRENRYELTAAAYGASDHCAAAAEYTFSCRNDASVAFDYEVMTPNGNDDSFYIQIDDGEVFRWDTGNHQVFEWASRAETTDVEGGRHTLIVHGREDGTKLRSIRFAAGGCGFLPAVNHLPASEPASAGVMSGTFEVAADYVWTPPTPDTQGEGDGRSGTAGGEHCLLEHPQSNNMQWFQFSPQETAAATALGWNQAAWDCDYFPSHAAGGVEECDLPASEDKYWAELTAQEQQGATVLGWNQESWDCGVGQLTYHFACSEDAEVTFSFESFAQERQGAVWDGTGFTVPTNDDSFFVEVDDGSWDEFHVSVTDDWTVHHDAPRSVGAGTHALHVHSRSAGAKLRTVYITDADDSGICGFTSVVPASLRLPDVQLASHGKVVAPMTVANRGEISETGEILEYVWAPDSAVERGCNIDDEPAQYRPQGSTCGRIEMAFVCDVASEVSFSYEILAPSGNDDSFFVAMDSAAPETWHASTTPVNAQTQCVAAGGLPNQDTCCAAGCGRCGGNGCGDLPGGADACCVGTINEAAVPCGTPPCVMAEPWEWHTPLVSGDNLVTGGNHPLRVYHVQPGLHKLVLHQREDGAKVRSIRFENRGSCGFATDAQLPDHMPVAFAEIHEPMIVEEGTVTDGFFAWVPDTEKEGTCNPANEDCGYATFAFSCATDSDVGFEYELRAPSGDDNQLGLQINDGPVYNWNIPTTQDTVGTCQAAGGIVNGDVCCAGTCGTCGGGGCGDRDGGSSSCCVGTITRSEVQCADTGGTPPCLLADPWEWRRFDGDSGNGLGVNTWPVTAGNHKLYIHTREDGVRLRNIRFGTGERGSCGFATELLLAKQQTAAFATVTPPMVRDTIEGSVVDTNQFFVWTPDDGTLVDANGDGHVQDDGRCHGHAACGLAEMGFSCSGPSKVKFDINLIALDGHTDSLFIQVDDGELMTWHIPQTESVAGHTCEEKGGTIASSFGEACVPAACGQYLIDYGTNDLPGGNCAEASRRISAQFAGIVTNDYVCCPYQVLNEAPNCLEDGVSAPCRFHDPFQWRPMHTVFDVDAGAHSLKIITREDGVKIRDARFDVRGTCGFAYEVMLPDTEMAILGDLIPPMQVMDDYIVVPNGAANRADGSAELAMICGSADVAQLSFEVSAPNGNDDSMFVQLDDGPIQTFHIPQTGAEGGAIGTGSADDTGHACTHDNCEAQVEVSCEALGGILGIRSTGSDACCPAACGTCGGHGCSERGNALPRLRSGGSACCPGAIARQAAVDMAESDRCSNGQCVRDNGVGGVISSFCGDAGVTPPCSMPMEFEWRSFMYEFDVEPGEHSVYIKAREDGTKIRAVSFAQRGTCGWAPQLLLPQTIDTTWGAVHAPMIIQDDYVFVPEDGTVYNDHPGGFSGPRDCKPRDGAHCGYVQFQFSCAGPSELDFQVEVAAIQGQNRIYLGVDSEDVGQSDHPPTAFFPITLQRTELEGPACEDVNGIRGGDACCPAECGTCGGSGCGSRAQGVYAIPGDPTSGSGCCQGSITRSERVCDAATGITAPCSSPDPFEWRTVGGGDLGAQVFVEGGTHTLEIWHKQAGAKIRNVRFNDRGSCGFTDQRPMDPAATAAQTALCQARLLTLGRTCGGGSPLPGLPQVSLPAVCTSDCAGDFTSFHADCRQLLQADGVPGGALHTMDEFLHSCNGAPSPPPDTPPLSTEECTAQFAGLNDACCTPAKYCRTGIPERCSRACVDPFLALYRDCYPTLQSVQNVDIALYDQLHDMCVVEQNRGAPGGGH